MENDDLMTVFAYIKGMAEPNPGPSAWGAILKYQTYAKEFGGNLEDMTSVRAEMSAVLQALNQLKRPCVVVIHSNLQFFVQRMINPPLSGLETNADLYAALEDYKRLHTLHWKWLKKGENEAMTRAAQIALNHLRDKQ